MLPVDCSSRTYMVLLDRAAEQGPRVGTPETVNLARHIGRVGTPFVHIGSSRGLLQALDAVLTHLDSLVRDECVVMESRGVQPEASSWLTQGCGEITDPADDGGWL